MKTKYGIFAGLFVLVAMIGMSPSFADSNTTVLSTNDGVQLTKTVVPMSIPSDNTMPWGFIEGTVENHAEGFPVILQIYQNDEPVHFAQTDVNDAKDEEITHLKNEIENLKTKVEIETIRAEIYNLKMLAQQK